jgi:pimeloyl-ACP methyl ester carboxylesterase
MREPNRTLAGPDPIDVREYGSAGPTIVVLHGGPGAPGSVAALARELGRDFRVIEPLQRRSGVLQLTVERHVADLTAVAPTPATLIGWSWGAMLALSFAARHPERTAALALIGCGTYDEASRADYTLRMELRLGPDGRRRMRELRDRLATTPDPAELDRLLAERGRLATAAQSVDPIEDDEPAGDRLPVDGRGHEETWADALRLQRDGIEPAIFDQIDAPVLMLHGDEDPHPGRATWNALRGHVRRLEYVGLPECGHEPWRERRARQLFFDLLRGWVTEQATLPLR